jgi:hypothetical protein
MPTPTNVGTRNHPCILASSAPELAYPRLGRVVPHPSPDLFRVGELRPPVPASFGRLRVERHELVIVPTICFKGSTSERTVKDTD